MLAGFACPLDPVGIRTSLPISLLRRLFDPKPSILGTPTSVPVNGRLPSSEALYRKEPKEQVTPNLQTPTPHPPNRTPSTCPRRRLEGSPPTSGHGSSRGSSATGGTAGSGTETLLVCNICNQSTLRFNVLWSRQR